MPDAPATYRAAYVAVRTVIRLGDLRTATDGLTGALHIVGFRTLARLLHGWIMDPETTAHTSRSAPYLTRLDRMTP